MRFGEGKMALQIPMLTSLDTCPATVAPPTSSTTSLIVATNPRPPSSRPTWPTNSGAQSFQARPASWPSSTDSPNTATSSTLTPIPGAKPTPPRALGDGHRGTVKFTRILVAGYSFQSGDHGLWVHGLQ